MIASQQSGTTSQEQTGGTIYLPQLDLIKGLAIISVIILHTVPRDYLLAAFAQFHIWQAVPVFFIILGITTGISFSRRSTGTIASTRFIIPYILSRVERIIIPFVIIFLISLGFGIYRGDFYVGWLYIIGRLPVIGNGNYFASILLQFIIFAPFMYYFYRKSPRVSIILFFVIELVFELVTPYIDIYREIKYLWSACIFRYFSAIALGLYLSDDLLYRGRINLLERKNLFILIGFPISIAYLFMARYMFQPFPLFWDQSNHQNLIAFFYPAVLIAVTVNWSSRYFSSWVFKAIMTIGKASYHIFLVQILFFGFGLSFLRYVNAGNYLIWGPLCIIINISITLFVGLLFYYAQDCIGKIIRKQQPDSLTQTI